MLVEHEGRNDPLQEWCSPERGKAPSLEMHSLEKLKIQLGMVLSNLTCLQRWPCTEQGWA